MTTAIYEDRQLHLHKADCLACERVVAVYVPNEQGVAVVQRCPACGATRTFGVDYRDEFGFHAEDWTIE